MFFILDSEALAQAAAMSGAPVGAEDGALEPWAGSSRKCCFPDNDAVIRFLVDF